MHLLYQQSGHQYIILYIVVTIYQMKSDIASSQVQTEPIGA